MEVPSNEDDSMLGPVVAHALVGSPRGLPVALSAPVRPRDSATTVTAEAIRLPPE